MPPNLDVQFPQVTDVPRFQVYGTVPNPRWGLSRTVNAEEKIAGGRPGKRTVQDRQRAGGSGPACPKGSKGGHLNHCASLAVHGQKVVESFVGPPFEWHRSYRSSPSSRPPHSHDPAGVLGRDRVGSRCCAGTLSSCVGGDVVRAAPARSRRPTGLTFSALELRLSLDALAAHTGCWGERVRAIALPNPFSEQGRVRGMLGK